MDSSTNTEKVEEISCTIRGDTIGDTAYSQRFVLNILIKLVSIESLEEDDLNKFIEKELCIIWDMASEKDVIDFLLSQNAMKIFNDILNENYNPRITEVIIGTLANMCSHQDAIQEVNTNNDIRRSVYNYISCDDSLSIVQVMRFIFSNIYYNSEHLESWLQFLLENEFSITTSYILSNSTNESLLSNTLEVVNCLCCSVKDSSKKNVLKSMFVNTEFMKCLVVGYEELLNSPREADSEEFERIENVFLSIHSVLTGFQEDSSNAYRDHLPKILIIINSIIIKYTKHKKEAIVDVVEYITACSPILHDSQLHESKQLFRSILKVWRRAITFKAENENQSNFNEDIKLNKELKQLIPQYFVRVFEPLTKEELQLLLCDLNKKELTVLSTNFHEMIQSETIHHYFKNVSVKLNSILNSV